MENFGKEMLREALTLLSEVIEQAGQPAQHFVVCGGSSLIAMELVSRTATRDVDVLARMEGKDLIIAKPLPDWINEAAESVRQELNLPKNWFNAQPSDELLFRCGFPKGMQERLTPEHYGNALTISYISRYDQIFFKLHAAVDQGGRHTTDLLDLKPSSKELLAAAHWTCQIDVSEGYRMVLGQLLTHIGHGDITQQL
jgi:hypothetical protein